MCLVVGYMGKPTEMHIAAVKRIMRYLQGTLEFGILYKRGSTNSLQLLGWTYFEYARDGYNRKNTSCYEFKIGSKKFHGPQRSNQLAHYGQL